MLRTDGLKKYNLLEILKVVKQKEVLTKPQISKETGLAPATVHNLVSELLKFGIIIEEGIAASSGGRKASQYSFNTKKFFIIGVDMGIQTTTVIVFDLALNEIIKKSANYRLANHGVEESVDFTINMIKMVLYNHNLSNANILGIGVSMPGLVDYNKGVVINLTNAASWRNVPLKQMIEKELKLPTIVDNDSNNSALYLKWQNNTTENLVYISTTDGLGTGLIIDSKVYRGENNTSGEIGHISIDIYGEKCNCGNNGCIEKFAADYAVVETVRNELADGAESLMNELCNNNIENITMDIIISAAKNGDAYAKIILDKTAKYICVCINNIIKIYDPGQIVISSTWLGQFPDIFNQIKNVIYDINSFINRENVAIVLNTKDDIFVKGGATLVMEHHFNEYNESKLIT